jgi:hypothetical protein
MWVFQTAPKGVDPATTSPSVGSEFARISVLNDEVIIYRACAGRIATLSRHTQTFLHIWIIIIVWLRIPEVISHSQEGSSDNCKARQSQRKTNYSLLRVDFRLFQLQQR